MFMKTQRETERDATRHLTPGEPVTTVSVERTAANANRWIDTIAQAHRLRRQRRMARALRRMIGGWSVRTL
jgi:hypothetical protein